MLIERLIRPLLQKSKKSVLLLGPRQVGKSTLIASLKPDLSINLARETEFLEFARSASLLEELIKKQKPKSVLIDEVQRIPSLLNTTQAIIDDNPKGVRFFLTGSSARKLKRGNANLLPGRVIALELGPLISAEMNYDLDTLSCMRYGSLPGIQEEPEDREKQLMLRSYSATYLKEEVQAEALTRNMEGFARFLGVVASYSSLYVDFQKMSNQSQIPAQSAKRYFEILEDTLLIHRTEPFTKSRVKRLIQHPRFFFFDCGVLNGLLENFNASEDRKGMLFENLIFSQLKASAAARALPIRISNYRTEHGAEVDFIVEFEGRVWAIEAKSNEYFGKKDLSGLKNFRDFYGKKCELALVFPKGRSREIDGIRLVPWQELFREMGL